MIHNKLRYQLRKFKRSYSRNNSEADNVVRLDDEQFQILLNSIRNINDNLPDKKSNKVQMIMAPRNDLISNIIKYVLFGVFLLIGFVIIYTTVSNWSTYFTNFGTIIIGILIIIFGIVLILASFNILKEENRHYIIALFSAIVSIAALAVTFIALNK
jgi:hypothetical protein